MFGRLTCFMGRHQLQRTIISCTRSGENPDYMDYVMHFSCMRCRYSFHGPQRVLVGRAWVF